MDAPMIGLSLRFARTMPALGKRGAAPLQPSIPVLITASTRRPGLDGA
jgi:hypothetical protein